MISFFFQSGYNLTDLYPFQEEMHREIAKNVSNAIIFLPQTISFSEPIKNNKFIIEGRGIYQGKNIFLMCRDKVSYGIAEKAFPSMKKIAFPDIVTLLIGKYRSYNKRLGYSFCVRNDSEGALTKEEITNIATMLMKRGKTEIFDTILDAPAYFLINQNRKKYVEKIIHKFQSSKVVITDKYHGFILSLVANTPVIVIKTKDHKLSEGIKWFPEEMLKYIRVADKLESIPYLLDELEKLPIPQFYEYFESEYFVHFKEIIKENVFNEQ